MPGMGRSKAWSDRTGEHKWRALRLTILERDGYACQIRSGPWCTDFATEVDHILGKGVSEDPAHLRAACRMCNARYRPPKDPDVHTRTNW